MPSTDYLGYGYGALTYGMGLRSFIQREGGKFVVGSKTGFIIGSVFGGLAFWGAYEASENPDEPLIAAANAGALSSVMICRTMLDIKNRSPIRGIALTIVSLAMFARYSKNLYIGLNIPQPTKK